MADYNEMFLGDLSNDWLNPTAHQFFPGELVLFTGSNIVTGSTTNDPLDRDFFTFEVPNNFIVSAIVLRDYQWSNGNQIGVSDYGNSYFALTEGNRINSITDDSNFEVSKLIDNKAGESEVGQDLLEPGVGIMASSNGSNPRQLGPGTYTVWYQETGAPTSYSFDVQLDATATVDYGQIQFDSSSFSVNEDAGTFDITLRRTSAEPLGLVAPGLSPGIPNGTDGNVGVLLRRFGGTAANLSDFNFRPVTAIFEQGQTERTFTYPLIDDGLIEGDETAIFELVDPMGGVSIGSSNRFVLTILDDDLTLFPIRIQAEDYTGFNDTTPGNTGGAYRNDDVDIEVTTDIGGGFNVGFIADGEWLIYDIDVPASGSYQVVARVASNTTDGRFHNLDISLDGQSTSLGFNATGGWQSWIDVTGNTFNLNAGIQELRLDMGSSGFNINYVDLIPV